MRGVLDNSAFVSFNNNSFYEIIFDTCNMIYSFSGREVMSYNVSYF